MTTVPPTPAGNWTSVGPDILAMDVPLVSRVLTLTACAMSSIGSGMIIITYFLWKDLQTMSRHLLLCLSIVDLVGAVSLGYGVVMNFSFNSLGCRIQSALSTYSETSSFFWTLAIAVYLYITIVRLNVELANRLCYVYHLVSWGVPAVAIGVVLAYNGLGWDNSNTTVGWCWVNLQHEHAMLWMLLVGKLWEVVALVTLPVLCVLMKIHIHREHIRGKRFELSYSSPEVAAMVAMDRRLTILPLMFVGVRVWGILRFAAYLARSRVASNWVLVTFHGIANCSQGLANCVLYFLLARTVRARLVDCLCVARCRPCSRRRSGPGHHPPPCCAARPCVVSCYYACSCACCRFQYDRINALDFYEDLAESSPLLNSARGT